MATYRQGLVDPGAALARLGVEHVGELGQLGATVALALCSVLVCLGEQVQCEAGEMALAASSTRYTYVRVGLAGREKVLNLAPRVAHLNDHSKCCTCDGGHKRTSTWLVLCCVHNQGSLGTRTRATSRAWVCLALCT